MFSIEEIYLIKITLSHFEKSRIFVVREQVFYVLTVNWFDFPVCLLAAKLLDVIPVKTEFNDFSTPV